MVVIGSAADPSASLPPSKLDKGGFVSELDDDVCIRLLFILSLNLLIILKLNLRQCVF